MRKIIFSFLILITLLVTACNNCNSGLYTNDNQCCTYVCSLHCENGYKEGTCNCECKLTNNDTDNTNLDDIFDNSGGIEPPPLPN